MTDILHQIARRMNPATQVDIARAIAVIAHRGQVDKGGNSYIEHPARVVKLLQPDAVHDSYVLAAAWLHDALEDTDITAPDLTAAGVDDTIVDAVVALSRVDHEKPEQYYARIRANTIATQVKLADITDNLDAARLALLDDATIARLVRKYAKARTALD